MDDASSRIMHNTKNCAGGEQEAGRDPGPAKTDEVSPKELGCALYELGEAREDVAPMFQ